MENKKILVVEDDNVLRDVLIEKLRKSGYSAIGAEDGDVAINKMREEAFDLILLDILMPNKDGMEVLEDMHKDEDLSKIPVIVISNSGQPVEIERALELGAKDFLIKAVFDPSEVLDKMEKVLNINSKTSDENQEDSKESPEENKNLGENMPPEETENKNNENNNEAAAPQDKVLVVEDDKFLRELFVRKLNSEKFDVSSAIDGENALEMLSKNMPNIVVLDLILPGMDGFEILSKIKSDSATAQLPVIVLSNLGQQEDIDKAMSLGADDFLVKANFTLDEIIERIKEVISKKRG